MPRRVRVSDSEEEESHLATRKSLRVTNGSQNPGNLSQANGVPDSEEEAEASPKGKKRARANTGGDSHQVKDEDAGSSKSAALIRDADG